MLSQPRQIPSAIVFVMGPTASGKSAFAMELCTRLDAEIVSVDSAQVYRGMDIGSAKPDTATRARVPHHLLDVLDPAQSYSAAQFRDDALRLIAEIRGRGRVPLLVGGTMLYFRALTHGLSELPSADDEVRQRLEREAQREGWPALHRRLAQIDPVTAARLHPNDQQRVQRALEIFETSGLTPTQFYQQPKAAGLPGPVVKLVLSPPERAELHRRIERRFHDMMRQGFLEEVRQLHARGDLHADLPSMRSVGYRQLWQHLDGEHTLDAAVLRGIAATRQFAKRQITWLRKETAITLLDPDDREVLAHALKAVEMTALP